MFTQILLKLVSDFFCGIDIEWGVAQSGPNSLVCEVKPVFNIPVYRSYGKDQYKSIENWECHS